MSAQQFGGNWSLIKLRTVEKYLAAYTIALKNKGFRLVYIDAFAGTGSFKYAEGEVPLFLPPAEMREHEGSALRATKVEPPFERLYFIDKPKKLAALEQRLEAAVKHRCHFMPGDANAQVLTICQSLRPNERGVIFLDPFGMSVEWSTLQAISATSALDVWYLFPLMGLTRQAARDLLKVDASKAQALTRVLGTSEWRTSLYSTPTPAGPDLFAGEDATAVVERSAKVGDIEKYVRGRLKTVFPYVAPTSLRLGSRHVPQFSLFFAVSNPSSLAQQLAGKIAQAILKPKS